MEDWVFLAIFPQCNYSSLTQMYFLGDSLFFFHRRVEKVEISLKKSFINISFHVQLHDLNFMISTVLFKTVSF